MIGILCNDTEKRIVQVIFGLFKIPWEFYEEGQYYDVVISTLKKTPKIKGRMLIIYNSSTTSYDCKNGIRVAQCTSFHLISYQGRYIPIYKGLSVLKAEGKSLISTVDEEKSEVVGIEMENKGSKTVRIGYNLFDEVSFLFSKGQPIEYARIPTLDLHFDLLKSILLHTLRGTFIVNNSIPQKMLVLTHDVDVPFLRPHYFDTVFAGILSRGIKSLFRNSRLAKRKRKALALSLGHAVGLTRDPLEGLSSCLAIEEKLGVKSTFFLVSRQDTVGKPCNQYEGESRWRSMRKIKYGRGGLKKLVDALRGTGNEIGLHGIDTWCLASDAKEEKKNLESYGVKIRGNRMHWLYWGDNTPQVLADAGFLYDSSLGYNTTIGFRCGTAKPFRFPTAPTLWELPMIVMDNALLKEKDLSPEEVTEQVIPIAEQISKYGGILTLNWHLRSFGYKKGWAKNYEELVRYLQILGFKCMQPIDIIENKARSR